MVLYIQSWTVISQSILEDLITPQTPRSPGLCLHPARNLLPVSMDLFILSISCKWCRTVYGPGFFHLACFQSSLMLLCYQCFIAFYCQVITFHCIDMPHALIHLMSRQTFGLFLLLGCYE